MSIARIAGASLVAATVLGTPTGLYAETRFPGTGAHGDAGTDLKCPPGMFVIGLSGQTGGWIDNIRIRCGRLTAEGRAGADWISPPIGGTGGSYNNTQCPSGMAVNAVDIMLTDDDRQVLSITPTCYGVFNGSTGYPRGDRGFVAFGGVGQEADSGILIEDRPAKFPTSQACPGGELATGFSLRYGKHVNAAGLICNKIVTAEPTPVAAPAPPPPPPKPAKEVAGNARGPGSPTSISVGLFDLPYTSESSLGGKFDLKFQVVGAYTKPMRQHVTGILVNTDIGPQYNGTFDGTRPMSDPNTVTLTYDQPKANAHGTVVFHFSEDGETFVGDGMHMGTTPFKWTGRRKHSN